MEEVYNTDNIIIYCGDVLEVLNKLSSDSIDLVVTSPPYNVGVKYDIYQDNIDWCKYYDWCKDWLKEIYRVLKPDGRFCLIHYLSLGITNNRQAPLMKLNCIAEELGFKHHGLAIWWDTTLTKLTAWGSWRSASAPYINSPFEGILFLYKNSWKKLRDGNTDISSEEFIESCKGIWKIQPEKDRKEHPAPFPVKLAERCIKLLSYEGDLVLDPFCGSGSVGVACYRLKRRFIGIDISKKYCLLTRSRIISLSEQLKFL